jgi:flagellar biosynthetic protein FliR
MFELIDNLENWMPLYMLVFARVSAMVASMPILGYSTVSVRIRVVLGFLLTLIVAPMLAGQYELNYVSMGRLSLDVIREVFIGLLIGFGARLIFEGFSMAGSFIGLQMGMAIMNIFDPTSEQNQPIISNFWLMVIIVFFLVTNSHHFLIQTVVINFRQVPVSGATFEPVLGQTMITGGRLIFDLALRFAAPVMIFLLVLDVAIAFMARVMPQLNIFFISLPLKIGAGIMLLVVSLKIFQTLFAYILSELETFVNTLIFGFGR